MHSVIKTPSIFQKKLETLLSIKSGKELWAENEWVQVSWWLKIWNLKCEMWNDYNSLLIISLKLNYIKVKIKKLKIKKPSWNKYNIIFENTTCTWTKYSCPWEKKSNLKPPKSSFIYKKSFNSSNASFNMKGKTISEMIKTPTIWRL